MHSQQNNTSQKRRQRRKRHPGNRKLRRFNKKCVKRGLTEEQKQQLINEYNRKQTLTSNNDSVPNNNNNNNNNIEAMDVTITTEEIDVTITTEENKKIRRKSNKRKRLTTSVSQRSISERLRKKIRNTNISTTNLIPKKIHRKLPNYLIKAPNLLFQNLRLQLKKKINKLNQKQFIHQRLQLLDQQYRLQLHQNFWQSYLRLGSEYQLWTDQVCRLAKSTNHQQCRQFVINRLTELNRQYEQCITELTTTQASSCPSKLLPLDKLDHDLKEFVHLQHDYLAKKMNSQLIRYKNMIEEKKLSQTISTHNPTDHQKEVIERLKNIRQKQMNIFEDVLKLETQVSMEFLPENFNHLDDYIQPNFYSPIVKNQLAIELKQKQYKTIQEAKRSWLNISINIFEIQYQDYEQQYQKELNKFQSITLNTSQRNGIPLFNSFITYMNHQTNRNKEEIYVEKIPIYRRKLLRENRRRLLQQQFKSKQKYVNVSPKIIIDLIRHPFTVAEIDYLSRGPTYIRPNQSALRPTHQREKQTEENINKIMNYFKKYMANVKNYTKIPFTSPLYKLYSKRLCTYLTHCYMTPLPFIDQLRARRDLKLVKSIQRKLKKYKLILRKTDKSGVFHIGRAIDYKKKAAEYRQKTRAYIELSSNPFNQTIYDVTHELNQMKELKKISEGQRIEMIPIREKTELPYMYNLPKSHKKGTPLRPIMNTIHGATTKISKFLDKLIRPLFDKYSRQTTIVDGVDLLDKLQKYIQQGHFKSSTLFVTFDINNLYTMLPQEDSLKNLREFLREHHCDRLNGISIDTIIELARLVLEKNAFVHDTKFYRQIIGGAMGSSFTLTLANIFMWYWEKQTILSKLPSHELYGSYPSKYINEQFQRFFIKYLPSYSSTMLPLLNNEQEFITLRQTLLAQPSIQQAIVTQSAAKVDIITNIRTNKQQTTTIRETIVKKKFNAKYENTMFIHWKYEARLRGLKRSLHEIHNDIFKNTEHSNIRLVIGDQNNPNLDFELARKRPHSSLLKDPSKRKTTTHYQPALPL